MACTLTKGRNLPCKSAVGGIKNVFFADYGTLGTITESGGEISAISGSPSIFRFQVKGNSTLDTAVTSSRENGTTFYESTLVLNLTLQEKQTQEEIKLLAVSRPHIFVEDYNGNYYLLGKEHGAELTTGTFSTGAAMGDLNGYSLTFVAQEKSGPDYVVDSVVTGNVDSNNDIDPTNPSGV